MSPSHDNIDFPVRGWFAGEPIPDLSQIDPERRREILRPLKTRTRHWAAATAGRRSPEALTLVTELGLEPEPTRASELQATAWTNPFPAPAAGPGRGRGTRPQVAVRLGPIQLERLQEAAELLGLRRTQLARTLIVNGVNRILYEERRRQSR
jgi:hypothetical protein